MLKRNKLIEDNRQEIRNFCSNVNDLIAKTKYLPMSAREEAQKALTELHDYIAYLDPTQEDVVQTVYDVYSSVNVISTELVHLIDIESDTAESITSIVKNYVTQ